MPSSSAATIPTPLGAAPQRRVPLHGPWPVMAGDQCRRLEVAKLRLELARQIPLLDVTPECDLLAERLLTEGGAASPWPCTRATARRRGSCRDRTGAR